ncbi:helix-turn-helix domain-containing protein [Actinoplanes sp. NPDC051861]|uniref:GlxA family transcriptional regulator n=1 Tax=Actinoplanes sp. NPDC051861 TaxID=3155170 RepID=UPI00343DC464
MGFRSVAIHVPYGVETYALGLVTEMLTGRFDVTRCGHGAGPLASDLGLTVHVDHGMSRLVAADLVVLLPGGAARDPRRETLDAVRNAYRNGAILVAAGSAVAGLAATGLLDGRKVAAHPGLAAGLSARFPALDVRAGLLYVDQGRLLTGAGGGAWSDLLLHLVRREHGPVPAAEIARELLLPPHRDGGQASAAGLPVPEDAAEKRVTEVMSWATDRLASPLTVGDLAGRAMMSARTFTRRFREATGTTPHAWLQHQRLSRAEELLVGSRMSVHEIARSVGYTSATILRERFVQRNGVGPREYRKTFTAGR